MFLAHRIALDPTNEQASYFARACGTARFAWNWALAEWESQYKAGGKPDAFSLRRLLNAIKGDKFPWMKDVAAKAVDNAILNLGDAFRRFFMRLARYPRFKKKGIHDSFTFGRQALKVDGCRVRIQKVGWVRTHEPLRLAGKIVNATVSRTADRWFISITVEIDHTPPVHANRATVGVDFGCTHFATLSTGEKIEGPKPHRALLSRLCRLNRSLHRKVKGSKNRAKTKSKLARLHARVASIRSDFLHKFTTGLVRRFTDIGIEDLNVSGMTKNHGLARSILDQSFGEARRQLTYKAEMYGCRLTVANRFYPSSKTCSACGHRIDAMPLKVREWACPSCGVVHDRDCNASINLEKLAAGSAVTACGAEGAGGGCVCPDAKPAALKQEPGTSQFVLPWQDKRISLGDTKA